MSITRKIMETVVQFVPDKAPDLLIGQKHGFVGKPVSRVDGQLKVKGEAAFTAEFRVENVAYAALVYSLIAKGKITKIDASEAEKAAGFVQIITHENAPSLKVPPMPDPNGGGVVANSDLPVFGDGNIYWNGQPVAVAVAETQDAAEYAASLVKVEYETEEFEASFDDLKADAEAPPNIFGEPTTIEIGDAEKSLAAAAFKIDNVYRTPRYNHNAIEPHATVAAWDQAGDLTIFDATQNLHGLKNTLAEMFAVKPEKVRVVAPFVGGGFGGKGSLWWHTALCAIAAKITERSGQIGFVARGRVPHGWRAHRFGTARRCGRRTKRKIRFINSQRHDGNHRAQQFRRTIHVSRASFVRGGKYFHQSKSRSSRHARQHFYARAGRINRLIRIRVGD